MVDKRRAPTSLWDPFVHMDGPLPWLPRMREEPRRATLSVSAISVAVDGTPAYVPVPRITGERGRETAQVLTSLGVRVHAGFAVLDEAPAGEDVAERALAGLGRVDPPAPFYLVRSGPGTDPYVAALPRLVHEFGGLGDDLGITHLDEAGGLAVFDLLSWSVPRDGDAVVLVVDQPVYVPGGETPATVSAVALRIHRDEGPVAVTAWGEGEPPVTALAAAASVFGGPGPCDAWLGLHEALRSGSVRDGDRVLLRAGHDGRSAWAELEIRSAHGVTS
ncbi:hypothetical protein [Actinophytocola oryzae]|uniref:Uncharacterized protein n=1 Tax=Actinophytocola oryzae TaxID=502181 RepID=A0A4R7VXF6_9PSEU|nr:hypothetical protein [Actinophytocola oryzae]TDV54816.1 hypothetical protein CLV71_10356 [Actinophytocola oryzae]